MFAGLRRPLDQRDEVLSRVRRAQFARHCRPRSAGHGRITQAGKRSAYPLRPDYAAKVFTHRTVMVGTRRRR